MSFPAASAFPPEPVSILLVDDDPGILETLVDIFEDMGFSTDTSKTGRDALTRMQERFYNLALLDIRLPDMEGTDLLAHARRLRPDMKCIMATGNASKDNAVAALNMGAHAYLEKPIDIQQVMATLNGALADQRKEFINRQLVRTLAESFLTTTPKREDVQIASRFEFAHQVAQVGGDYFDFIEFKDREKLGIVIGDVCGKGVPAAIYTGKAKDMLYAYARLNPSPAWVISQLNQALYSQMSEECMFITMIYGVLDTSQGTFTYTNAAHPPAIVGRQGGEIAELGQTGGMVGALEEMEYEERTVRLEPGGVLALFTDGVTEARANQKMLGQEGVREVVQSHADAPADRIAEAIFQRAREFAQGVLRDDVAIVVVKNG
jgi:serine phosphatase RsbU (regulator of sigma subunit)